MRIKRYLASYTHGILRVRDRLTGEYIEYACNMDSLRDYFLDKIRQANYYITIKNHGDLKTYDMYNTNKSTKIL